VAETPALTAGRMFEIVIRAVARKRLQSKTTTLDSGQATTGTDGHWAFRCQYFEVSVSARVH